MHPRIVILLILVIIVTADHCVVTSDRNYVPKVVDGIPIQVFNSIVDAVKKCEHHTVMIEYDSKNNGIKNKLCLL